MAWLPAQLHPSLAMLYIACILTILITAAVVVNDFNDFKYRFGKCVFFASYGLIFGLGPMMQSTEAYVQTFGESARTTAALYSLAGLLVLLIGFQLAEWPTRWIAVRSDALRMQLAAPENQRLLECLFWGSLLLTAGAQLLMMYSKEITLNDLLVGGRFEHRFNDRGIRTVLAIHLTSFAYVPAFIGLFLSRRYRILTFVYVLAAGAVFFFVFSKGTRAMPLALCATTLVAASIRYQFSRRHVMMVSGAGFVLLVLAVGLSETRKYQNSLSLVEGMKLLFAAETYQEMWDRDPLNYSTNLVGAVAAFPDDYPYLNGATYRRMAVFFLKESDFPDLKPPDTNVLFGLIVHDRSEELQVTVPPSILGDVYINFWGWYGLPFLLVHGMLYCWMLRFMRINLLGFLWFGPLSGRFLTLVHRGEPYEMFVLFVMFIFLMTTTYVVCRAITGSSARRRELPGRIQPFAPPRKPAVLHVRRQ